MHVVKCPHGQILGHRCGTAIATRSELLTKLGQPNIGRSGDDKVTIGWKFATPRGLAEIRDYWWNKPDEWSIAAQSRLPALWLARYLRRLGIGASTRWHYSTDARPFGGSHG